MTTLTKTPWAPVLAGPQAEAAWRAVWDVSRALDALPDWSQEGPSLSGGAAGAALFQGYLAKATGSPEALAACQRLQAIAGDLLVSQASSTGLFAGFPGVGWAAAHLQALLEPGGEDCASEIDEALDLLLARKTWQDSYDLIIGLVGHGVYALERLEAGLGRPLLARVIGHLERLAVAREEGLAWFTPAWQLPAWQREFAPEGYWNLGLAHGIPGVLALLGRAIQAGVATDTAQRLLEGGVAWLLARRNPKGTQGWYNTSLSEGLPWTPQGSRVAWCYGDLGLAAALLSAARDADRPDWEATALRTARDAAARPRESRGVRDAGLCHGSAGNALIHLRLWHATGEDCFRQAALDHLDWTLAFRNPAQPFGGFPQYRLDDARQASMHYTPGLLEGGSGVALTLLAALTDQAPDWDRHLLISLTPRSRA